MRTVQDEINEVSDLPEYYTKYTSDIEVVPTHIVKKWINQSEIRAIETICHKMESMSNAKDMRSLVLSALQDARDLLNKH